MTGCLAYTFGGEIARVPSALIRNICLIAFQLLSLQLRLFMASHPSSPLHLLTFNTAMPL